MLESINQAMITFILIIPGYICYTLKEMWFSYREKTNFEKLLNSLVCSVFLWIPFWIYSLFDLPEKADTVSIFVKFAIPVLIGMPFLIIITACSMAHLEQKGWIFKIGEKLDISVKRSQGVPLLEYLINRPNDLSSVEVETMDGCVYRGNRKRDDNWEIIWGSHPYSGDISFICHYFKDKEGNEHKYTDDKLQKQGYLKRTYIPKSSIKTINYMMKY